MSAAILKALCSGYSWFIVFLFLFLLFLQAACKYGNKNKEEDCMCYRNSKNCNMCMTDLWLVGMVSIALAFILLSLSRIDSKIDNTAIEAAKWDGHLREELTKQSIEIRELQQKK